MRTIFEFPPHGRPVLHSTHASTTRPLEKSRNRNVTRPFGKRPRPSRRRKNGLIRTEIALICTGTNEEIVDVVLYLNSATALFERTRVVKTTHVSRARDATMLRLVLNAVVNGG